MALYCRVLPGLMAPLAGSTVIDWSVAEVTEIVAEPVIPLSDAVMFTLVPAATPEANPSVPAPLLMLATAESAEPQLTWVVMFWVVVSE